MEESKRFEILLEDIRDKMRVLIDGHNMLSRQIQEVREEAKRDNLETRHLLEVSVKDIRKEIVEIKQELRETKEDVKVLKEDVKILKEDVKILKEDVKEIREELEETREELGQKIDRIAYQQKDHEIRIRGLQAVA